MAKPTNTSPKASTASSAAGQSGPAAGTGKAPASASESVASPNPLPKAWSEIAIGSLVIGHESHGDGWWEAIVTEVRGDVLTLRWRDYPKQAAVTRNRKDVALLFAGD
jgi:hypothetical protein